MKIKRLVASVSAGFEDFVSKVENHEAVADCVIDDVRRATAQVKVQKNRTDAVIARTERQADTLEKDEQRWNERAVKLADSDGFRALECVRRARQAAEQRATLLEQLEEHRGLAADLGSRLAGLEQRLAELQLKRTALSSRAARAQTLRKADRPGACESVDTVFDRWETAVLADEYCDVGPSDGGDMLDLSFRAQEEEQELAERLAELKAQADREGES